MTRPTLSKSDTRLRIEARRMNKSKWNNQYFMNGIDFIRFMQNLDNHDCN